MANKAEERKKRFEETFERLESRYGKKEETKKTTSSTPSKTTTTTTSSNTSTAQTKQAQRQQNFDDTFARMEARYNKSASVDNTYIRAFFEDAQSFLNRSTNVVNGLDWKGATSGERYNSWQEEHASLQEKSEKIRSFLRENKDKITSSSQKEITSLLDSFYWSGVKTKNAFTKAKKYYSQWNSEDEYKTWHKKESFISEYLKDPEKATSTIEHEANWVNEAEYRKKESFISAYIDDPENAKSTFDYDDRWLEEAEQRAETARILKSDDFKDHSGYVSTASEGLWEKMWSQYGMGYDDLTYEYINNQNGMRDEISSKSRAYRSDTKRSESTYEKNHYDYMTSDEVSIYNYYYSKHGKEKAEEYLASIAGTLEDRANNETVENASKFAKEHPVISSALSVGTSILSGQEYVGDLIDYGKDKVLGKPARLGTNEAALMTNAVRGTVSDQVDWEIGNWDAFDFLYSTAMSGADSLVASTVFSKMGGVVLGLSAAAQGTNDALARGMSDGQAFWNGLLSGVFEGLFESVSIGNFNKLKEVAPESVKDIIKNLGKSMLVNASEETLTELANIAYDTLINGEFANYTWEELQNGAWKDALWQVVESGASGALMGVGMGGVGNAIGYFNGNKDAKQIYGGSQQELVGEALEINPDNAFAQNMQARLDIGKNLSGRQLNRLVQQNEAALTAQDMAAIQSAAENRLAELGETGDVGTIAAALAKQAAGQKLTRAEQHAIANSKYGQRVANELNTDNIQSGEYSSTWAESLDTQRINAQEYSRLAEAAQQPQEGAEVTGGQVATEEPKAAQAGTATLEDASKKYGLQAQAMVRTYLEGQDVAKYDKAYQMAYDMGKNGVSLDYVKRSESTAYLTDHQREMAYEAGAAAQNSYDVAGDGKTILQKTGETVSIQGIVAVNDGQMTLKLTDGRTVNAADVAYASQDDAIVYGTFTEMDMDADDANSLLRMYQAGDISASTYSIGVQQAYRYGKKNFSVKELEKADYASRLTEEQRMIAYKAGQQASDKQVAKAQMTVSKKERVGDKNTPTGKVHFDGDRNNLTERQSASLTAMEKVAEALGVQIYVFESKLNERGKRVGANGLYNPNDSSIHIDLHAGATGEGTMLFTLAHELTHHIHKWSPAKFKVLADFLMQEYGQKGVSVDALVHEQMAKAERNGRTISDDTAYEEVVADSMETMLSDGKVMEKLAKLKAQDKSLWQKIKDFISELAAKIRAVYEGMSPDSVEGRHVAEMVDAIDRLQDLFTEALVDASENFQSAMDAVVEAGAETVAEGEIITDGAVVTDGEGTKYSIRSMKQDIAEGQMFEDLKTYCGWTQKQVNELRNNLADLVEYMTPYRNILDMNETYGREGRRFSPYKPNSDPLYKISMDFSTLCSKRLLTQYVIENLQLRENRPMSAEEQMAIRDMLNEYRKVEKGLQVACAMCYVEAARLKSPKQITKWMTDPETQMRNYFADKNPEFAAYIKEKQSDFKEARGYARNATKKDMSAKDVRELNKIRPRLRSQYQVSAEEEKIIARAKALPNSTYLTAANLANLSETDPVIYSAYTAFVRTATRSKSLETDEPYYYGDSRRDNGNGIVVSDDFIEAVNRENGMRFSSWSDWRIQHLLDYITAVIDNSVRGAAMHGYTKFGEEVRVLGKTGMMFNMSGVAGTQTGLNEDGSLSFSPTESIDVNEAIQLREEFPDTAGLQCIGVGDDHIVALLRSDIIDYVIPYHTSGLNAGLRAMANIHGWSDYTTAQHAAIDKNIKFENAVDQEHWREEPVYSEFFVGYDTGMTGIEAMRASADRYVQMCNDRGLKPKFEQFVKEDNYWKLLIDRKMVNQKTGKLIKQKAVTPTFDFDTVKSVVDQFVQNYDSGLEARALNHVVENWDSIPKRIKDLKKQGSKKVSKAVDTLANQTLAAQPVAEEVKLSDRDNAPTFYSHMAKVVDGVKQEKLGAASVVSMLRGKGVKAEEIKWSGIETWLEGKKSVTKAELQEFIAGSMLQIEEETLDYTERPYTEDQKKRLTEYEANRDEVVKRLVNEWKRITGEEFPVQHPGPDLESTVSRKIIEVNLEYKKASFEGRLLEKLRKDFQKISEDNDDFGFDNWRDALRSVHRHRKDFINYYELSANEKAVIVKYCNALNAYNELQNRISEEDSDRLRDIAREAAPWNRKIMEVNHEYNEESAKYMPKWGGRRYNLEGGKNYREVLFRIPDSTYTNDAMFTHWDDKPGILAHARIQDFDTFIGKMLFVEELQSDWHNEGHKTGYQDVPDAPFRDNYHEYVLKRLIRMAAEQDYDSIGWTPAQIQVKRWSEKFAEGYRIEYDQDIPKFLNKYGKKWGTRVGKTVLDSGTEVWSVAITDSMKESVLNEGQPLYSDRDSDGNQLSADQQEFFAESKARDDDGNLYVMYHGSRSPIFTEFDLYEGVWMTPDQRYAEVYAEMWHTWRDEGQKTGLEKSVYADPDYRLYKMYANITNPLDLGEINDEFDRNQMNRLARLLGVPASRIRNISHHDGYQTVGFVYEVTKDHQFIEIAKEKGYDGFTATEKGRKTFCAFSSPNQVKLTTNEVPSGFYDIRYSDRDTESVSNRSLLANAFEGVAQNDIEKQKIQEYKGKISLIESEERKLSELNQQIKDLSFAKGPKDTKAIRDLQFEAKQTANRISTYDKQLLRLEASKPLQDVLTREKKMAYQRAEKKGKEALEAYREKTMKTQRELISKWQESRKKGVESRHKTAMRHKIKDVVNELNQYLLRGTKDRHVPIELQKAVAEALDAVNMDTVGAEERIAKLQAELMKAKTPEKIQEISRKIDHIREMGDKMNSRLKKLKDAYDEFVNSDDPLIANSHDDVISNKLQSIIESVGETPLRDMTLTQLEDVYDMYRMVLTAIRNTNKAFKAKKSESISIIANQVMMEVEKAGGKSKLSRKGAEGIKSFFWNNLKPVYAFEHIGSDHFTEVFNNVRAGEDVWALDVTEAREFYLDKSKKHGYDSWDFKKRYKFTSTSGMEFSLDLEQIMSLYAYSKRDQAADHLKRGGIVIDETTEITMKNKLGIPVKFNPTEATAYNISDETLANIISRLTDEQKSFVDEMQDYLSTVMGAKGNEVSLEMYGVKLFKEKFYFPLKSAQQFMAKAKEQQKGEVKIKNAGFSKETVQKASNPIVLTPFMNVWADHVNEMSMYHAFVLPMEDFYRVYNYKTPTSETMATESVEMFIQNAYGKGATKYIDQLLKDLNGGARTDNTTGIINKMMGLFKKGAVFASLSVVIQQPSAIARAAALVDTKYFIGPKVDHKKHAALWGEVKQYAPVAVIKEMGYFDTNMGKSTQDFILSKEYSGFKDKMKALFTDSGYRDEALSKAPALADEIAWCGIWEAVKRETKAKNPGMDIKSEAFLQKAGERFTEVIVKTQVYDSVLSRSGNMRSKDTGMKMATAFMAEPTTSINMITDALLQGKRGNRKYARSAIGAVIASQILNSILVSFVYAGRDDDEDETYWEKYIGTLSGQALDSLNPAGYIPFIKDIMSIVQGYDVERSDMAVISDLWKAYENLSKDYISPYRKVEGFVGSIAQIFGLPVKNIMRDARGIYQTIDSFVNGQQTTKAGIGYAVKGAITGKTVSNDQQLYEAILSGDQTQIARVKGRFKDQTAINNAIRKALRANDPRIHDAAVAWNANDLDEYMRIAREIIGEKFFVQDDVVSAIRSEASALEPDTGTSGTSKAKGLFTAEKFAEAIAQGDQATANAIKTDIIQTAQKNGKTAVDAEKSFASSAKGDLKELYMAGTISKSKAINALTTYCGENQKDAEKRVEEWTFEGEHGFTWSDRGDAYKSGAISAQELKDILVNVGGKTEEEAMWQVKVYDWQKEGFDIDSNQKSVVEDYETYCEPAGIDKNTYFDTYLFYADSGEEGVAYSKTIECMPYIDSLPLSASQKTALAQCWWAASTVDKYKLW